MDEVRDLLLSKGWTYDEMVSFYRKKYGVETTRSMWSKVHKRLAGDVRQVQRQASPQLWPWITPAVLVSGQQYAEALRTVDEFAQEDIDEDVPRARALSLHDVRQELRATKCVIDYDRDAKSFVTVPRRAGIDGGWIRNPYYNDDHKLIPVEQLRGKIREDALAECYPFDFHALATPPVPPDQVPPGYEVTWDGRLWRTGDMTPGDER